MFEAQFPQRIICLTEEGTEILYEIGQEHRLVGISGFTRRPKIARKEKPKVSNFIDANFEKILELKPDLVVGYSDLQGEIASELIKNGINVFIFNHRSINETLGMILQFCALIGNEKEGRKLVENYISNLNSAIEFAKNFPYRPKVFFEEWNEPLISSILRWTAAPAGRPPATASGGRRVRMVTACPRSSRPLAKDRPIKPLPPAMTTRMAIPPCPAAPFAPRAARQGSRR